jgi:predicted nucleotidyltransferase
MKTREEILKLLLQSKQAFGKKYGVRRMALFGSYARGDQRTDSDVDVLVDVDPSIGLEFVSLAHDMESLIGLRVDVVSRRAVSPRHWKYIEKELIDV